MAHIVDDKMEASDAERGFPAAQEEVEEKGVRLDFLDVTFEVCLSRAGRNRGGDGEEVRKKRILDGVTGTMVPGNVLYIMGASGVGKSVLLDSLAGRTHVEPGGQQWLNGVPKSRKQFRNVAQYCTQEVVLYESLTVEETLFYAAAFYTKEEPERKKRTEEALRILNLEEQAKVRIGGTIFRGVSGGQKKRVAVGEAMMAQPKILFLDEPTSNLDSSAAYHLVTKLKDIAYMKNTTVAATIHQPSERVFEVSDELLLLGKSDAGGKVAYFGPRDGAVHYFLSLGHVRPKLTSAAEWMMDLLDHEFSGKDGVERLLEEWKDSDQAAVARVDIVHAIPSNDMIISNHASGGYLSEVSLLTRRFMIIAMSNPTVVWLRYTLYIALALAMGPVWWQVGKDATTSDVSSITGGIFAVAGFFSLMSISVLPSILEDKAVVRKERANGNYHVFSFCFANFAVSTPLIFFLAAVCTSIFYWIAALNPHPSRFFFFILNLFVTLMVSESVCMLVAMMLDSFVLCTAVCAFIFGTYMSVSGFLVRYENIPIPWNWLHYVSFHSYAFANFIINEFEGELIKGDATSMMRMSIDLPGELIIADFGFSNENKWNNIGILVSMAVGYRLLAYIWIRLFLNGKK